MIREIKEVASALFSQGAQLGTGRLVNMHRAILAESDTGEQRVAGLHGQRW